MAHERKLLRDAIVTRLVAANTVAGARVTTNREPPLDSELLPAILVFTESEKVDEGSQQTAPRELKRTAILIVEAWVAAASDALEDAMDAVALEIETAMDQDINLSNPDDDEPCALAFDSMLIGTEFGVNVTGETPFGCVHLEYAVTYHSDQRPAVAVLEDFDTASVRHNIGGAQDEEDEVTSLVENINQEP